MTSVFESDKRKGDAALGATENEGRGSNVTRNKPRQGEKEPR